MKPIPKQITTYLDVPGFNNSKHLDALMEFASNVPKGSRVLEIGCAWGCSTWALLDSLPDGVYLHTCDTFGMNHPALKQKHFEGVMAKHHHNSAVSYAMHTYIEENLNAHRKVFDWVIGQHPRRGRVKHTVHQKPSTQVLEKDVEWSMVYIDGLHSYENVSTELKYLKDVSLLCGDDYHPAHPGTVKAIDEFLQKDQRVFEHHDFDTGSGFWTATKQES
jgi:hypothetical protein